MKITIQSLQPGKRGEYPQHTITVTREDENFWYCDSEQEVYSKQLFQKV